MQFRFLEYFVALAQEKHFARAAALCNVAQPTLSAGIAALEESLGGRRLVLRDRRFVDLTDEGRALLPWARRLLDDHAGLKLAVLGDDGAAGGELRLGTIPAAMPMVGPLVRALAEAYPQLTFQIRSMTSRQIEQALIDYELDAGLTYLDNEPPAQVRSAPLYAEHYVLATPADAPLAGRETVRWADVAATPLCLLHQGMQNRRILDAHLAALGLEIVPRAVADSYVSLVSMVDAGGLSSILPDGYARLLASRGSFRLIPIVDPVLTNDIGLVVFGRGQPTPLAAAALRAAETLRRGDRQ